MSELEHKSNMTRLALSMRSTVSMFDAGHSIAAIQQGLMEEEIILIKKSVSSDKEVQRQGMICHEEHSIRSSAHSRKLMLMVGIHHF